MAKTSAKQAAKDTMVKAKAHQAAKAAKKSAPVAATKTAPATRTAPAKKPAPVVTKTAPVKKPAPVANLAKVTNQVAFLENYLRGTGKTLSAAQARANYGIGNLSARMSEFRKCGLQVRTDVNTTGKTVYAVSARDTTGSRSKIFN
jgi:hypothetical protein